ncbi:MAG: TIGR04086 family membrane protein [Lachnospiraceae bacterium]
MERKIQKESKGIMMLKSLLLAYVVTGILLLVLTMLLYKLDLDKQKVTLGIIMIYVLSTFAGGLLIGKLVKVRRFLWGLLLGVAYFTLLLLITLGVYHQLKGNGTNAITSFLLCAGGGMLGGMIS